MSPKLTPAAATRIRTSPGPGTGTGASVNRGRSCGAFRDVCCKARMVAGMLMAIGFLSLACVIEVGIPTPRKTRRERKRNRSERPAPQERYPAAESPGTVLYLADEGLISRTPQPNPTEPVPP